MIKLTQILKEALLLEKIVKLPQHELDKAKELYDYIDENLKSLLDSAPTKYHKSKPQGQFKGYFKLNDLRGNPISVSVSFYNDEKEGYLAQIAGKVIYVNLSGLTNLEDFEEAIEHELIHAADPKVNDPKVVKAIHGHKQAPLPSDGWDKYYKSPDEFDSFSTPLVKRIQKNLDKTGEYKKEFRDMVFHIIRDMKTMKWEDLIEKDDYRNYVTVGDQKWNGIRIFSGIPKWDGNLNTFSGRILDDFFKEYSEIKAWSTKPTLYKRFLKRLGMEL